MTAGYSSKMRRIQVLLSEIEPVSLSALSTERLALLQNGFHSFDECLSLTSDPIILEGEHPPYSITDGRHRIYLARQKGYTSVSALLA